MHLHSWWCFVFFVFLLFSNHKNAICSESAKTADLILWNGQNGTWSLCFEKAFVSRELGLTNRSILDSGRARLWLQEHIWLHVLLTDRISTCRWFIGAISTRCHRPLCSLTCSLCAHVRACSSAPLFICINLKGLRCMCIHVGHLGRLKENWYKWRHFLNWWLRRRHRQKWLESCTADLYQTHPSSIIYHPPLRNSFSLPGKSRSFYLMWCFYVQFPSPTPIIGRYATVAGNKAADSQQRQQSKLGETFKRSHLLKLWQMSNSNVTQRTYLLQLCFQTIME